MPTTLYASETGAILHMYSVRQCNGNAIKYRSYQYGLIIDIVNENKVRYLFISTFLGSGILLFIRWLGLWIVWAMQ